MPPTSPSTTAVASPSCGWSDRGSGAPSWVFQGGFSMHTQHTQKPQEVRRRELLKAGLAAGVTLSAWPLSRPPALWGAEAGQPRRGGILRVRGYDPPHFDPHVTLNFKTNNTLSFVYNKLVRHRVGAGVAPGTFVVEPDLAERWEELDDTTVVFHLRRGMSPSSRRAIRNSCIETSCPT